MGKSIGVFVVIAGVGVAVGCGGEAGRGTDAEARDASAQLTKEEYVAAVRTIESTHGREATRLYMELAAGDGLARGECARRAQAFHQEVDAAVAKLFALAPPTEIERLHRRFIAAVRGPAAEVEGVVQEIDAGQLRCGAALNERLYDARLSARVDRILDEYRAKGYLFGSNSQ